MDSSAGYSVPLPPSLPNNGSLPARRLQTQVPVSEPPACVQNAMMTKDKKPFTYTPGGIDLSQIKSPRMAKRIARNAQYEGVTNQPKPSPLAQEQYNNNSSSGNSPPVAPPPPASAMGMPVQVFPTGPPPPPPAPSSNSSIPPPPPPMSSTQLTPQSNGRDTRKSPTPQNFEPPPLGCRPEIKIPPNPMATLRKVPKPEPKNDFWVQEYRKERSKSPMAGEPTTEEQCANQPVRQEAPPTVSSPKPTTTASTNNQENDSNPRKDPNRIAFQQQQQQQQQRPQPQQYQPPPYQPQQYQPQQYQPQQTYQPPSPRPVQPTYQQQNQQQSEPSYPPHMDPNRIAFQQQRQQPPQQQKREVSPVRTPVGFYQQQQQRPQPTAISPNAQPNVQRPMSPVKQMNSPPVQQPQSPYYARQQQQQPQYQPPQQQQQTRQYVTSPPPQQKPAQVGSLYIAPVPPENLATGSETPRSAGLQQTPPWLAPRPNLKENPDWVREVNSPTTANRTQTPPINQGQVNNGSGLRLQMNQNVAQSNAKERIIPIQIEKTPTPSRTPSTPGFGPQPYSPNNQYGSVTSPGSGYSSPSVNNVRSPNQFVDQGYNTFPNQWQNQQQQVQQRVVSPPAQQQQGGGRIVPIAIERDDGPFNPNVVRGPISPAPMVIQNDPRGGPQSRSPNGMTPPPNQSKSFRVLQKITDTDIDRDSDSEQPVELHGPQYSKQMGDTTDQMRRMQINDSNQQAFVNRGPIQRQTQRYVQQRPIYQQEDQQQQQYVHPSEQQAPEPKIYTGSAIPSRSFKLLQAMTTPENAGPGQSDL